ncbi:kinase-like domain-containing protein [Limtongia smithiae]|uniref:kinase-like domain-containing protein n=1 Tax=Limtongia smithiae TaxID=1125753 RepID=UPI0034CD1AF0
MLVAYRPRPVEMTSRPASPSASIHGDSDDDSPISLRPQRSPGLSSAVASVRLRSPGRQRTCGPARPAIVVKETLDAHFEELDDDLRRLNQYIINEEVGRGSYGAVYRGIDTVTGTTYAIKEFSKRKLRRNLMAKQMRQEGPHGGGSMFGVRSRRKSNAASDDPLNLIRPEIAILKQLDHVNIARLIEVLDDPSGDSLFVVLEWCSRGALMDVPASNTPASPPPYTEEQARLLFRDLVLGVEYLHSQEVVHRDIKPDNALIAEDGTLKIVDFGISEIIPQYAMNTPISTPSLAASSTTSPPPLSVLDKVTKQFAGSPAFMAPEQVVFPRIDYSGRAADIWAMGVTLYCITVGCLPFWSNNQLDLFELIEKDEFEIPATLSAPLHDLIRALLTKDYTKRIKMTELRVHPWITQSGEDPLVAAELNTAAHVKVTDADVANAFSKTTRSLYVLRALSKFKILLRKARSAKGV